MAYLKEAVPRVGRQVNARMGSVYFSPRFFAWEDKWRNVLPGRSMRFFFARQIDQGRRKREGVFESVGWCRGEVGVVAGGGGKQPATGAY